MFRGLHAVNLDAKGRLAVPSRFREKLTQQDTSELVVTIDTESPCLLLYPFAEWELIERKLESLPSFNAATRRIQRLLIGHATELEIDATGRILLPPLLRSHAQLDKHIMFVGQGKKFELWDEQQWCEHREKWLTEEANPSEEIPVELRSLSL
ncbi:MAG: division/cell wall cluster transcriptional repressor MraZ [Gammaproteobacteria bacterium]|nr:division/cell wall cluster transcriptional repressor MraZ [Gammaproteobacteria bacterium]